MFDALSLLMFANAVDAVVSIVSCELFDYIFFYISVDSKFVFDFGLTFSSSLLSLCCSITVVIFLSTDEYGAVFESMSTQNGNLCACKTSSEPIL